MAGISLVLASAGFLFGACGGSSPSGVASLGSTTSTTIGGGVSGDSGGPPTAKQLVAMTKWAACVRKHGLPNFPDPPYQGGELNKLGYTKDSPRMIRADKACRALGVAAGAVETKGELEKYIQQDLKIADCMHTHGFPSYPDPNSNGAFTQSVSSAKSMASNPAYSTAAKACDAAPAG